MKKTITLLTILSVVNVFATDRVVNPNLSQGNGTTVFVTITDAVAAAQNGDRIIVKASSYNEGVLTIDKSIQIIPQTPGTTINYNGNIEISGFSGMNVEIIGFELGVYEFRTLNIPNGDYNNRARVAIIDCTASRILSNKDFYNSIIINNQLDEFIVFKHGSVFGNTTNHIVLIDEAQDNNSNVEIRNKIISNNVSFLIGVFNNDYPFTIANNSLRDLSIRRWSVANNVKNEIKNNNIKNNASLNFSQIDVPEYNLVFSSNLFEGTYYHINTTCDDSPGEYYSFNPNLNVTNNVLSTFKNGFIESFNQGAYHYWFDSPSVVSPWGDEINNPTRPSQNNCGFAFIENGPGVNSSFPNLSVPGFFEWSYNGVDFISNTPDSSSPLTLTKIIGQTEPVDGGNPNHEYYDIDLSINDRGVNGGPYSQLNYNASNPNNSRAFIFDLEMPADLFPGENVEIKAQGYHSN